MDARSYLFVPGNRPERFDKAFASGADQVVLDLEDAVAADAKGAARDAIARWAAAAPDDRRVRTVVRCNDAASPCFEDDLRLLRGLCDFRPRSLFDTMFAAQLLNIQRFGLAALLEQHFGVRLDKDHQKANWSKRPIERAMLDYAAEDVFHLFALRDRMTGDLTRLGRMEWLEQKCRWQIEVAREGFAESDENAWRIGGSEKLNGRGLTVLHAVWHWRESWAEKLDTPPFKVTGNELLMRLATVAHEGKSAPDILHIHLGRRHDRLFPSLAEAVRRGLATDPHTLPRRERRRDYNPLSPEELARQDRLKAGRDKLAQGLNLDPTLIATRTQLVQIAREPASIESVLLPWQARLLKAEPSWQG